MSSSQSRSVTAAEPLRSGCREDGSTAPGPAQRATRGCGGGPRRPEGRGSLRLRCPRNGSPSVGEARRGARVGGRALLALRPPWGLLLAAPLPTARGPRRRGPPRCVRPPRAQARRADLGAQGTAGPAGGPRQPRRPASGPRGRGRGAAGRPDGATAAGPPLEGAPAPAVQARARRPAASCAAGGASGNLGALRDRRVAAASLPEVSAV